MNKLLILVTLFASGSLLADTIKSRVHSIQNGMIKFENGRVAFLDNQNPKIQIKDYLEVVVDERSSLVSYKKLTKRQDDDEIETMERPRGEATRPLFEPTIVPSMEEAWNIFNRSNPNYKRISECSDRAHVWAHEEFKRSGTKSLKTFIFFTSSYINSVRFKWWFHVAPSYKVSNRGKVQDLVLDYRYADRPMQVKEWTDLFVYTKRPCKVTTKFSEYDENPQTENCYLIFESMHYRLPLEIHAQELSGTYKTETPESELKMSYQFAFRNKK